MSLGRAVGGVKKGSFEYPDCSIRIRIGFLMLCMLLVALGCTAPEPSMYLAFSLEDDGEYEVQPREIPPLNDHRHMKGALGDVWSGGLLALKSLESEEFALEYRAGRQVEVLYTVVNDVARPLDRAGLVLYSFYGHLYDTQQGLVEWGIDVGDLFPVTTAVSPAVPDIALSLSPAENAAYVSTAHTFVLLDDLLDKGVPLAANAGVVVHEFAHAMFQWLTLGDLYGGEMLGNDAQLRGVASLNEGFADMVAALLTGQPRFISASLEIPERWLDGDATAGLVETLPDDSESDQGLGLFFDPYALGTVFGAVVWDVAEGVGDRESVLVAVVETTRAWGWDWQDGRVDTVYAWLDQFLEVLGPEGEDVFCESVGWRFEGVHEVDGCS